jgi:hypothetical protein
VALAEHGSLGLNYSFFLNRFQILPLVGGLKPELRRAATYALLEALCRHYADLGRDFVVGLCPMSERPLYQNIGCTPLKQYRTLAIAP